MRFSEAIRLGSMLHPQCFGSLYRRLDGTTGAIIASCAIGAVYTALGYTALGGITTEFDFLPWMKLVSVKCPECGSEPHPSVSMQTVTHLNDTHHWTRERIADWVESLESGAEATVAQITEPEPELALV